MTPMGVAPPPAPAPPAAPAAAPGTAPPPPPPGAIPYGYPPTYAMPRRASASSMLSGTFDVWVKNFGPFFLVYLVLSLVTGGLTLAGSYFILGIPYVTAGAFSFTVPSNATLLAYVAYEVFIGIVTWVFTSLILGGVVDMSIRTYRGENVRLMDSLSRGFQRVLSIMGANLLVTVITVGVIIVWAAVLILGALSIAVTGGAAGGIAAVCGALVALPFVLVFVLYLVLALSLYAPAIMMEGSHAVDSLGRSWNLTRGHKWSLLGAGIVLGILLLLLTAVITGVGTVTGNAVVQLVTTALGTAITGAWFAILTAVAYELITKQPQPTIWPPTYTPAVQPPR
jgi:hypothetical protein